MDENQQMNKADGQHHLSPIHHLCNLEDCSRQAESLRALLRVDEGGGDDAASSSGVVIGLQEVPESQLKPIDLLLRNLKVDDGW